jgi:8-oxo-dGTP pyrophosphatase MutT (NUDIX family)
MTLPSDSFSSAAAWYESLATLYGSAAAVITSPSGEVLLVKPNYREGWNLPGGTLEHGEAPRLGCAREVLEELGLDLPIGDLLSVTWIAPARERPRPIVAFLFDGGEIADFSQVVLQEAELDDYRLVPPTQLAGYLWPGTAARVLAGLAARGTGAAAFLEDDGVR